MVDSGEEKVQRTNGTVENNIVFLGGFFEQLGFEYVSGLEHEFVSVSPPGQSHLEPQGEFFRSSRLSQASTGSGLDGRRGIRARKLRCGRKDFCNAYTAPCNFYMLRQPA